MHAPLLLFPRGPFTGLPLLQVAQSLLLLLLQDVSQCTCRLLCQQQWLLVVVVGLTFKQAPQQHTRQQQHTTTTTTITTTTTTTTLSVRLTLSLTLNLLSGITGCRLTV